MANYTDAQREYHKSRIRLVMTVSGKGFINHGIDVPLRYIQQQLDENGLHLNLDYIAKIKNKIIAERIKFTNKMTSESMKSQLVEALSVNLEQLYQIIYSKGAKNGDKISAMAQIKETYLAIYERTNELQLFEANMKKLIPQADPTYQISEPKLLAVVEAMVRFNLLPKQIYDDGKTITARPLDGDAPSGTAENIGA